MRCAAGRRRTLAARARPAASREHVRPPPPPRGLAGVRGALLRAARGPGASCGAEGARSLAAGPGGAGDDRHWRVTRTWRAPRRRSGPFVNWLPTRSAIVAPLSAGHARPGKSNSRAQRSVASLGCRELGGGFKTVRVWWLCGLAGACVVCSSSWWSSSSERPCGCPRLLDPPSRSIYPERLWHERTPATESSIVVLEAFSVCGGASASVRVCVGRAWPVVLSAISAVREC